MSKNRSTFIDTQRVKACCQNPPSSSAVSISHSTKQLKQQTVHTKPLTKVEIYCSLACKFNALLFDRKAASNEDPLSFLCYHSMKLKSRHSELPILTFYQFPSKLDIFGYGQIPYIWCVLTLYGKALEIELQLGTYDFTVG